MFGVRSAKGLLDGRDIGILVVFLELGLRSYWVYIV